MFHRLLLLVGLTLGSISDAAISPEDREFFEANIRPVLATECYECHNSHGTAKGGLVLDFAGGLLAGGDSGPAIVPGQPNKSRLLLTMRHELDDLRMPKEGAKVDVAVLRDIDTWIKRGAPDPREKPPTKDQLEQATSWDTVFKARQQWWSFQPIAKHQSGKTIDDFLDARINSDNLTPTAGTEPRVLLRRLSFALTGVPPTREEIAAFLKHGDIEREIDRLLASTAFGERWARHWMDWWRYADSHGSEGDPRIAHAWQYRDYLIRALNADVPYDQLLREHVAGDVLTSPRINAELGLNESAIGPAHFRMVFHGFAPTDALDELVRFTDNQVDVLTKASMGLTVSCARCHDHKFDAISQADFYGLYGVLASTRPGMIPVDSPERRDLHKRELQSLKRLIKFEVGDAWLKIIEDIDADTWKDVKADKPDHPLYAWRKPAEAQKLLERTSTSDAAKRWTGHELLDWFFTGTAMKPNADPTPHAGPQYPLALAGDFTIRREGDAIFDQLLPTGIFSHLLSDKHSATFTSPTFRIGDTTQTVAVKMAGGGDPRFRYVVQNYPRNGTVYPVKSINHGELRWEQYDVKYWRGDDAHIELTTAAEGPVVRADKDRSWFGITDAVVLEEGQNLPTEDPALAFRAVFAQEMDKFVPPRHFQSALREAVKAWFEPPLGGSEDHYESQMALLTACVKHGLLPKTLKDIPAAKDRLAQYRALEAKVPVPTRVPGLIESQGRDAPLYIRGNHKTPGEPVPRRFLDAIDNEPFLDSLAGRPELADKILADNNPFTKRVIVNRLWHHLFGTGLVSTPDNLGRLGEKPSHPELLDQLARQFEADGWSLKSAIKHMVSSKAFQRASTPSPAARERDPDNRLLSHFPVRRLEAEAIRDTMIHLGGGLEPKMYGPGVNGNSGRRSVYIDIIRNRRDAFLQTFDAPDPLTTRGRRNQTNVPGQSLTLLNDPRVIDLAKRFAAQKADATDDARIAHMYESALGRLPTDTERNRALAYVRGVDAAQREQLTKLREIDGKLEGHRATVRDLLDPAREALLTKQKANAEKKPSGPAPVAHWVFEDDGKDQIGDLHATLKGGAKLEGGGVKVGGKAYAETGPLPFNLKAKTLLATVQLETLDQRAGGVMNVQTSSGAGFDAIVFAEQEPKRWMAGSDNFRRTVSFGASAEEDAAKRPVTLAITYDANGTITGYRDGAPYGKSTRKQQSAATYRKGDARVVFGCRHTPAGGNRNLSGRILEAKLFDRKLSAEEVLAASQDGTYLSARDVLASLSDAERTQITNARLAIADLEKQRSKMAGGDKAGSDAGAWPDLAQAIFNVKEFIYIR